MSKKVGVLESRREKKRKRKQEIDRDRREIENG